LEKKGKSAGPGGGPCALKKATSKNGGFSPHPRQSLSTGQQEKKKIDLAEDNERTESGEIREKKETVRKNACHTGKKKKKATSRGEKPRWQNGRGGAFPRTGKKRRKVRLEGEKESDGPCVPKKDEKEGAIALMQFAKLEVNWEPSVGPSASRGCAKSIRKKKKGSPFPDGPRGVFCGWGKPRKSLGGEREGIGSEEGGLYIGERQTTLFP